MKIKLNKLLFLSFLVWIPLACTSKPVKEALVATAKESSATPVKEKPIIITKAELDELFSAVLIQDIATVEDLIKKPGLLNSKDKNGRTALFVSVAGGDEHLKTTQLLIKSGADLNLADKNGWTPLFTSVVAGGDKNLKTTQLLIKSGANLNLADKDGSTPLFVSVAGGDKNLKTTQLLIKSGANLNLADKNGWTPLFTSVVAGGDKNLKTTQLLIKAGADLNLADKDGRTPLHNSVIIGDKHLATIKLLLNSKADLEKIDTQGDTAILLASYFGQLQTVKLLVQAGANIHAVNWKFRPPMSALDLAVQRGHYNLANYLRSKGATKAVR